MMTRVPKLRSTADWCRSLPLSVGEVDIDVQFQRYLILSIANRLSGDCTVDDSLRFAATLDLVGEESFSKLVTDGSAVHFLLAASLLKTDGALRGQALGLVLLLANTLSETPDDGRIETFPSRFILSHMGLMAKPRVRPLTLRSLFNERPFWRTSDDELRDVETAVAAAIAYGEERLTPGVAGDIRQALEALAVQRMRSYDLELGCSLMRAVSSLGSSDVLLVRQSIDFLLAQRRRSGAFGFFGPELATFGPLTSMEEVSAVDIPVTLACVWTIHDLYFGKSLIRNTN